MESIARCIMFENCTTLSTIKNISEVALEKGRISSKNCA
jgi:hypothetical protein